MYYYENIAEGEEKLFFKDVNSKIVKAVKRSGAH